MTRTKKSDEDLIVAVRESFSYFGVLRKLGLKQAGGSQSHYKKKILKLGIDTSHFTGQSHNKGKIFTIKRKLSSDVLVLRETGIRQNSKYLVRSLLDFGVKHECSKCGQPPVWMDNPLTLDVDHINENWLDDRIENLRFLCPNCHSQFSRNLIQ